MENKPKTAASPSKDADTGEEEIVVEDAVEEVDSGVKDKAALSRLAGQLSGDPRILAAFQQKSNGDKLAYLESLPKSVKRRLKALKRLQAQMFEVEAKFYQEVHDLESKYAALCMPYYDKREKVVNGGVEPTDSDCEWESDDEDEEEAIPKAKIIEIDETKPESEQNGLESGDKVTGVPEFWLTIFKNVDALACLVQDNDEPILKSLVDVRVKFSAPSEPMGFVLEFVFAPNDYFTNTILTKEYTMKATPDKDHPLQYEGPEIIACKGCKIDWKANKNVTVRKKKVKGGSGGKGGAKKSLVTKLVKVDSFFNFFSPPPPVADDEEQDDERRGELFADFEIGQMLQDRIVPRAVLYFTGEAIDDGDDDDGDFEGEDEDDEDDEDDDGDSPSKGAGGAAPDCKQQ